MSPLRQKQTDEQHSAKNSITANAAVNTTTTTAATNKDGVH